MIELEVRLKKPQKQLKLPRYNWSNKFDLGADIRFGIAFSYTLKRKS